MSMCGIIMPGADHLLRCPGVDRSLPLRLGGVGVCSAGPAGGSNISWWLTSSVRSCRSSIVGVSANGDVELLDMVCSDSDEIVRSLAKGLTGGGVGKIVD